MSGVEFNSENHYRSLYDTIWLAFAPPGKWNSGPAVISGLFNNDVIFDQYNEMNYTILGPYKLEKSDELAADSTAP